VSTKTTSSEIDGDSSGASDQGYLHRLAEEKTRAEEVPRELDAARTRYFDLYNLAPAGYCTLIDDEVILEANHTASIMLCVDQDVLPGKPLSGFIFPEDLNVYSLYRKKLFETGVMQVFELRMIKNDDTYFWAQLQISLTKESDGRPICLAMFENVTDRKMIEEDRKNLDVHLSQIERLEAIGRLAGGIAHDYNNILQIILGNTEILLTSETPSSLQIGCLNEIKTAGRRAADLTRQLLAFARKEAVASHVLDINHAIESMLSQLRSILSKETSLVWNPSAGPCFVKIDCSQLNRILTSLITNAGDAIAGPGRIDIKTEWAEFDEAYSSQSPEFMPSPYVLLSVSDTGCGIDGEMLDYIFEPFFTTKPEYLGCGLGLASLYGMVLQNNGFIKVDSQTGKGTTFKIYLPRHTIEEVRPAEPRSHAGPPVGIKTILLVEDEYPLLMLYKNHLKKLGYNVLAFDDPVESLDMTRSYQADIHLLLTDVSLPKMNGPELARRLAILRPQMKCIFMSGYNSDILQCQQGLRDEDRKFLQKPFPIEELVNKINEVLSAEKKYYSGSV
jgi:two-component system cell cycle sensor histidine kinase/response regulator CckA